MIHKRKTDTAIIQEYAWVLSHNAPGLYNFEYILSISEKLRLKDELINKYHAKGVSYAQIHEDVIRYGLGWKEYSGYFKINYGDVSERNPSVVRKTIL